ncbi:MAG: hypothetical protein MUF28_09725 [Ignavibacterium sp.]|nr:hypothetical protein [Ignavibacterium sp.]
MKNHSKTDFQTKCVHSGIYEYEYGSVMNMNMVLLFLQSIKLQHSNSNPHNMVHPYSPVKKKDTFTQEC